MEKKIGWLAKITLILNLLTLAYAGGIAILLYELDEKFNKVHLYIDKQITQTEKVTNHMYDAVVDQRTQWLLEVNTLNKKTQNLQRQINILDSSIDTADKRKTSIYAVANAIKRTLPGTGHPLKECRSRPTPGEINTIATAVVDMSQRYNISMSLILGIIRRESAFCQQAVSRAGARGLMQLMPATAKEQQREIMLETGYSPKSWTIKDNIWLGTYYISKRLIDLKGNEDLALKAYNAGINHVQKVLSGEREDYYEEPKEYSKKVLEFKNEYQQMGLK